MKNYLMYFLILAVLAGCVIGHGAPSKKGPPYMGYWLKANTGLERKIQDSNSCGGISIGPTFTDDQLTAEQLPGENKWWAPRIRLVHKWESCMLDKGYIYIGECLDNEVSRARPACNTLE